MNRTVITGVGKYLPPRIVTNEELAPILDVAPDWVERRTGIRERRYAESGVGSARLGAEAARVALQRAGRSPDDVDCIISASLSPDCTFPGNGMFIQHYLGMTNLCPAYDIAVQCSGFLYALAMAHAFIQSHQYSCILVVGAEVQSAGLEMLPRSKEVSVLFGDGAGAVIVEPSHEGDSGLRAIEIRAEGRLANALWIPSGMCINTPRLTDEIVKSGAWCPQMNGAVVLKHAIKRMPQVVRDVLRRAELQLSEVALVIVHQANLRIIELVASALQLDSARLFNNIDRYGNTTSASIPICLAEAAEQGRLSRGDVVVVVSFGSGFSWGAAVLHW